MDGLHAENLADASTMAMVLGWIHAALGPSAEAENLVAEVYRRVVHDCPRWLRAAPLREQLKSLTVIAVLNYDRRQPI